MNLTNRLSGISSIIGVLMLIVITITGAILVYGFIVGGLMPSLSTTPSKPPQTSLESVQVLDSGGLVLYVRNLENYELTADAFYIIDPITKTALFYRPVRVDIPPKGVGEIIIPSIFVKKEVNPDQSAYMIKLSLSEGGVATIPLPSSYLKEASQKRVLLGFLANISSNSNELHWVIFDYSSGHYWLCGNHSPPRLITEGYAPILEGINEYTITTTWIPWDQRPIDSPIIIVVNPTYATEDWIFTWHALDGTFKFYLQKLEGEVEIDFLVFWEDIYYPPTRPSMDDWKDHVVRVTSFTNGTYRIAVFMAKGGYSHKFYVGVDKPWESLPSQTPVYQKSFGAYWSNINGGYCIEITDKIWYVKL